MYAKVVFPHFHILLALCPQIRWSIELVVQVDVSRVHHVVSTFQHQPNHVEQHYQQVQFWKAFEVVLLTAAETQIRLRHVFLND